MSSVKHITVKDIAKELKISASTVSRALSDHPDISTATKRNVLNTAEKLNYFPDSIAQSLKTKNRKTIGVIVPEIKHLFFSNVISGIEDVAYNSGYTIIVCQSNEDVNREIINTRALLSQRVSGIIVSISQTTSSYDHFFVAKKRKVPIVFFDRVPDDFEANKVIINDKESAYNAVKFLIQKNYKRIAHFGGANELRISKDRCLGYKEALVDNGIEVNESLIIHGGLHEEDGYKAMEMLLKNGSVPDAIFAVNDPVAIGAFTKIKEAGLEIPKDIALIGFSNNPITSLVDPKITTIDQHPEDMGKLTAETLIAEIEKEKTIDITETKVIKSSFVEREST